MGIGSKPFMDIKPSDAAISDRAIDYIMKGTGELLSHFTFNLRNICHPIYLYLERPPARFSRGSCRNVPCAVPGNALG